MYLRRCYFLVVIEDILEDKILECLAYIYNKNNHTTIMHIVYLRSLIYFDKKEISSEELMEFIIKELNLPNQLTFNGCEISLTNRYDNNCLLNIIDNLIYRHLEVCYNDVRKGLVSGKEIIGDLFLKLSDKVKRKSRTIKDKNKKYILKSLMLTYVNEEFNLEIRTFKRFEGFIYPEEHNDFEVTFDECCNRYYDFYIQQKETILEKHLEDYIYKNGLPDIKILKRQLKTENGIIDMFGIDDKGNNIIIELKVVPKPRDLLWQINLYKNDFLKLYNQNRLRVIVIAPKLDKSIKEHLPEYCELFEFKKNKDKFTFKKVV